MSLHRETTMSICMRASIDLDICKAPLTPHPETVRGVLYMCSMCYRELLRPIDPGAWLSLAF